MSVLCALLLCAGLLHAQETADVIFEAIDEPPARAALEDEDAIEKETARVASLLRCPVCQGLSVEESREGLALAMKDRIRELVAAGYDQDQIIAYFVERYGESIVLLPDERHWMVWMVPNLALLLGLGLVGWRLVDHPASRPRPPASTDASAESSAHPPETDDTYRQRVLADLEDT